MATRVQILDEAISHSTNTFGKGMHLTILLAMGKLYGRLAPLTAANLG